MPAVSARTTPADPIFADHRRRCCFWVRGQSQGGGEQVCGSDQDSVVVLANPGVSFEVGHVHFVLKARGSRARSASSPSQLHMQGSEPAAHHRGKILSAGAGAVPGGLNEPFRVFSYQGLRRRRDPTVAPGARLGPQPG